MLESLLIESNMDSIPFFRGLEEAGVDAPGAAVWVFDLDSPPPLRAELMDNPPPEMACRGAPRGERHRVAYGLVREILSRRLHIDPTEIELNCDAHGRLHLAGARLKSRPLPPIDFNIAHSENVLLVGVCANGRIGVDGEVLRVEAKLGSIAPYFSAEERQRIAQAPPDDRPLEYYRCWTAKEAFVKAIGLGLSFGLNQVETASDGRGRLSIARVNGSERLAQGWTLVQRTIDVGDVEAVTAVVFVQ